VGCSLVTLDAMGCQREIVNQIVEQKADYLITLKKNQGGLYQRVDDLFKEVLFNGQLGYENENVVNSLPQSKINSSKPPYFQSG
jgi:hypothetical protein